MVKCVLGNCWVCEVLYNGVLEVLCGCFVLCVCDCGVCDGIVDLYCVCCVDVF